ncbi:uncharacterized protein N7479_003474 [Penicillium vulpinum]|uniref:Uncharacterized protein n=1 Tax=Penicillium vulpinum TaxID=29845 RepID=A0A1V6RX89_9EURO|nr:uncharacterized protein N7479_003474 [Penicillium vulpinum]KAJ5963598.1 hypothetical protein N7479_003474 [Penicillium vulpinum]OQE06023.1 hypothetical protein PENVUL_c020G02690 [Penicillium vulpinum]
MVFPDLLLSPSMQPIPRKMSETANSKHAQHSDGISVTNEDDRDLLKLGYRSSLARGWSSLFHNFACSFSALNCVGSGILRYPGAPESPVAYCPSSQLPVSPKLD